MVVELAVLAPLIVFAVSFVVWAGRQPAADGEVRAAARSTARAAALEVNPVSAASAGVEAGRDAAGLDVCTTLEVTVDTTRWRSGWVSAEVRCEVKDDGLPFDGGTLRQVWTEQVQHAGRLGS